jgi:hypothetical protein
MTLPWSIARFLPFRVWRLYWRLRLQRRERQLAQMRATCDRLLARNQEMLDTIDRHRARFG